MLGLSEKTTHLRDLFGADIARALRRHRRFQRGARRHDLRKRGSGELQQQSDCRGEVAPVGMGDDRTAASSHLDAKHTLKLLGVQEGIGQIVTLSSASVYCDEQGRTLDEARENGFPDLPDRMMEDQRTVEPGPTIYSTRKIAMERTLLERARVPAVVLRPRAIHGPYSAHPREWWFVKRLLDGRSLIPLAFGGQSRFQTSATANIAALVSTLASSRSSGIFNAADPDTPTVMQIGEAIGVACGKATAFMPIDNAPSIGTTPWSVPKPFTVRRQNIWRNSRRKVAEGGPRLWIDIRRRAFGAASADVRWSVV